MPCFAIQSPSCSLGIALGPARAVNAHKKGRQFDESQLPNIVRGGGRRIEVQVYSIGFGLKMGAKAEAGKRLPAYAVWHAHQLQPRDLMFGSFMLLTFCLYLLKTVPAACSIGPEPFPATADTISNTGQQQQQQWPLAWRFFCRNPLEPVTWPLTTTAQHTPPGADSTFGSCANPAPPHVLSQDSSDAYQAADANTPPSAANARLQEQPAGVMQRGIPT
jgi:hypothetical protein